MPCTYLGFSKYSSLTREEQKLSLSLRNVIVRAQGRSISAFEIEAPLEFKGLADPVEL